MFKIRVLFDSLCLRSLTLDNQIKTSKEEVCNKTKFSGLPKSAGVRTSATTEFEQNEEKREIKISPNLNTRGTHDKVYIKSCESI